MLVSLLAMGAPILAPGADRLNRSMLYAHDRPLNIELIEHLLHWLLPLKDRVARHPLFVEMGDGSLSLGRFRDALLHFYPLVEHFPKYMGLALAKTRPGLTFHATLGDTPDPAWAGTLDQVIMQGNAITTEAVFFHRPSGTVIVTDLIQHLPDDWFSGWRRLIAKWDRMTGPEPAVPRKFRLAFTNRKAARAARDRLLAWPAERLVMAHGAPVTEDAAGLIRRAFAWL